MTRYVTGRSFSDDDTRAEISRVHATNHYTMDPHTAVGMLGLRHLQSQQPGHPGIVLATAHPAKFPDLVEAETGGQVPVPDGLARWLGRPEQIIPVRADYEAFTSYLMDTR